MSDYGVFEASSTDGHEEEQRQRQATRDLGRAIEAAREGFGDFLSGASDKQDYSDRLALVMNDLMQKVADSGVMPVPGVMRKVKAALRPEFRQAANGEALEWAENHFQKRGGDKSDDPAQLWKDSLGLAAGEFGTNFSAEDYARHSSRKQAYNDGDAAEAAAAWAESLGYNDPWGFASWLVGKGYLYPMSDSEYQQYLQEFQAEDDPGVYGSSKQAASSWKEVNPRSEGIHPDNAVWKIQGPNGLSGTVIDEFKSGTDSDWFIFGPNGPVLNRKYGEPPLTVDEAKKLVEDHINSGTLASHKQAALRPNSKVAFTQENLANGYYGIFYSAPSGKTDVDIFDSGDSLVTELTGADSPEMARKQAVEYVDSISSPEFTSSRKQAESDPYLQELKDWKPVEYDAFMQTLSPGTIYEPGDLEVLHKKWVVTQAPFDEGDDYMASRKQAGKCPNCDGMGRETYETDTGSLSTQTCKTCGGTGKSKQASRKVADSSTDARWFFQSLKGQGYTMPKDAGAPGDGGDFDDFLAAFAAREGIDELELSEHIRANWGVYAYGHPKDVAMQNAFGSRKQANDSFTVDAIVEFLIFCDKERVSSEDHDSLDLYNGDDEISQDDYDSIYDFIAGDLDEDLYRKVNDRYRQRAGSRKTAADASYEGWTARIIYDEDDFEYAETTTPSGEQADSIYPMDGSHFEGGELREALEELAREWGDDAYSGTYQYNSSRKTALDWSSVSQQIEGTGWDQMYKDYIRHSLDLGVDPGSRSSIVDYSDDRGLSAGDEADLQKFINTTAPRMYGKCKTAFTWVQENVDLGGEFIELWKTAPEETAEAAGDMGSVAEDLSGVGGFNWSVSDEYGEWIAHGNESTLDAAKAAVERSL